ncbi:AarF/ABC1/UbiB kinase family protein [Saccharothrix syringae]|uniref:AarF/ABC1/UbiB kinase family protein n=2 Tax=Saccharothrix syringae TaxID=103733 RepID=A0A5Q0GWM5_SACSY|nr:AarF/ABC1/UbiB kinase family protein [Saccharothrix syringae]
MTTLGEKPITANGDPSAEGSPADGRSRSRLLATAVGNIASSTLSRPSLGVDSPPPEQGEGKDQRRARAVRAALERLGPFYIKLGQILSTRPDLVSDAMIAELEKLHDRVTVSPFGEFAAVMDQDMPAWRQRFRTIDVVTPLGSASLAQVYRVTLHDGTPAVVKVQRPGIRAQVLQDMKKMRRVARLVGRLAPRFNELIDVDAMLQVIFNGMEPELDFTLEAQNMVDARRVAKEFKHITVPKVIDATPRVLVQTLAPGVSIGDADPAAFTRKERKKIGRDLLKFMYQGYFSEHVFHADPHPGNIFVHPGEKANIIDWGMVGKIDRNLGRILILVLLSIAQNDAAATARGWVEMGHATARADLHGFAGDMSMLIPKISSASLEELNFGVTLSTILMYATRRGVHTSPHISLLGKSFANVEGSVRNLAPELSMVDVFEDAMVEIMGDLFSEFMSKNQAARFALDAVIGGTSALDYLRKLLRDLSNRDLTVQLGLLKGPGYQKIGHMTNLLHLGLGVLIAWIYTIRKRV